MVAFPRLSHRLQVYRWLRDTTIEIMKQCLLIVHDFIRHDS